MRGGRQVRRGRLVRTRVGADLVRLTTPDGDVVTTGRGPSGELLAVWRASRADTVVAASSELPAGALARLAMPPCRRCGACRHRPPRPGRIAATPTHATERAGAHSWAHARAEWLSGQV